METQNNSNVRVAQTYGRRVFNFVPAPNTTTASNERLNGDKVSSGSDYIKWKKTRSILNHN